MVVEFCYVVRYHNAFIFQAADCSRFLLSGPICKVVFGKKLAAGK